MKLNNNQIDALVAQAAEAFGKANKPILVPEDKKLIALAKKYSKILHSIPIEVLSEFGYVYVKNIQEKQFIDALKAIQPEAKQNKEKKFDRQAYRNKILIASIDSKDLAELQIRLKK